MNYLKIKKKLNNILPKFIFNFIIYIWRNSFIKFNNFIKNNKLINFDKEIFKKIKINNISYLLKLNPNNWFIDKKIYTNWIYEKEIYTLMYKNISKNYICVDIWANIWMYTNFLPKLIWKKWKVIWFEPIKSIYKQNNESIKKNWYINVKLYNYACSDKEEDIIININDENIWWSSLIYNNKHNRQESIKSIIWDSILLKEAKIDFIKIDTEWHELNVLNWIIKTIEKFKPKHHF